MARHLVGHLAARGELVRPVEIELPKQDPPDIVLRAGDTHLFVEVTRAGGKVLAHMRKRMKLDGRRFVRVLPEQLTYRPGGATPSEIEGRTSGPSATMESFRRSVARSIERAIEKKLKDLHRWPSGWTERWLWIRSDSFPLHFLRDDHVDFDGAMLSALQASPFDRVFVEFPREHVFDSRG